MARSMAIAPCPHCQGAIEFEGTPAGQTVACPHCHAHMELPRERPCEIKLNTESPWKESRGVRSQRRSGTMVYLTASLLGLACLLAAALAYVVNRPAPEKWSKTAASTAQDSKQRTSRWAKGSAAAKREKAKAAGAMAHSGDEDESSHFDDAADGREVGLEENSTSRQSESSRPEMPVHVKAIIIGGALAIGLGIGVAYAYPSHSTVPQVQQSQHRGNGPGAAG